jgi:hypothetical protein
MADKTSIEWTDATLNVITGCKVLSPGCTNCYAMRLAGTRRRNQPNRNGLTVNSKIWPGNVKVSRSELLVRGPCIHVRISPCEFMWRYLHVARPDRSRSSAELPNKASLVMTLRVGWEGIVDTSNKEQRDETFGPTLSNEFIHVFAGDRYSVGVPNSLAPPGKSLQGTT